MALDFYLWSDTQVWRHNLRETQAQYVLGQTNYVGSFLYFGKDAILHRMTKHILTASNENHNNSDIIIKDKIDSDQDISRDAIKLKAVTFET